MKKENGTYKEEFKLQIVKLYESGKAKEDLEQEYGVSRTSINKWLKQYANSGKFGLEANRSEAEKELRDLRKENKHLRMENDILKQAAVIFARREP